VDGRGGGAVIWRRSYRADPYARAIADRHYNRQSIGAANFVPPGRCFVLTAMVGTAFWVTSWPFAEYVKHRWGGAWVCSAFRRESGVMRASDMIREAIAATRERWPSVPDLGMVTFIDRDKVQPTKVRGVPTWGRTWLLAGFEEDGETQGGLLAFRMRPENMPPPMAAIEARGETLRLL
jgi:hypothetical protein